MLLHEYILGQSTTFLDIKLLTACNNGPIWGLRNVILIGDLIIYLHVLGYYMQGVIIEY